MLRSGALAALRLHRALSSSPAPVPAAILSAASGVTSSSTTSQQQQQQARPPVPRSQPPAAPSSSPPYPSAATTTETPSPSQSTTTTSATTKTTTETSTTTTSSTQKTTATTATTAPSSDTGTSTAAGGGTGTGRAPRRPRRPPAALSVTPAALERLRALLDAKTPRPAGVRVGLRTRGCNGMAYVLNYADEPSKFDEPVHLDGASVFIDPRALIHIVGTTMDFVDNDLVSEFVFNNPNAKGTCGCGESFNV